MNQIADFLRHLTEDPDDPRVQLRRQLHALEASMGQLKRGASRAGHKAADNAAELLDEALSQGAVAAKAVSQGVAQAGRAVGRDPLPLLIAIGTIGLLARLVSRR